MKASLWWFRLIVHITFTVIGFMVLGMLLAGGALWLGMAIGNAIFR